MDLQYKVSRTIFAILSPFSLLLPPQPLSPSMKNVAYQEERAFTSNCVKNSFSPDTRYIDFYSLLRFKCTSTIEENFSI
jgi:hypothetical protein